MDIPTISTFFKHRSVRFRPLWPLCWSQTFTTVVNLSIIQLINNLVSSGGEAPNCRGSGDRAPSRRRLWRFGGEDTRPSR